MDAPTSFFFGLEKKNGQRRVIHLLLSGTGQEITEASQIRRRAVSFYSTLYTSEYEEGETLSEGFWNGLPQVSEEANSQLEGPLTIQELQTALQGMQGRRAPGIDGLSVEFYRAYWDVLSNDLLDDFNESLASGSMPVSCRRAVITLLPKKGNLQDIKNWRPVSLLCVDYKLLSKALATRLGRAVEQVIHRDQTYCVPGRSMVDNVHLIRDVLEVSSSLDINTGLISLDQEKAFDRVEHSFLWKVMEKFGFSAGFIAKIKVLYNNIESVLKFNARLDVSSSETTGLTVALCRSKTLCLQQLVDAVGPELSDAQALGSLLGLHSVRVAQRILQLWSQILCPEEKRLLRSYGQGGARPDPADPFPEIYLSPGLGELTGPLLQVEKVNCVIETGITRKGEFSSLRQWWDHGKTEIRLLCQQHTLNVTQDIIRSMKDLESDIVELETISETTGDRGYIEILKEKKMALANLLDVKVQGALVRSRFLNTNEMDAPTSFFFGLEKKNGQRRVIHSLLSGTGQEITEPSQIRRRAVSFYSTLYTSEYEEGETLSEGFCNGLPQVSEEANSQLEGPLTIQELQTALQGMQGRRAPGIDGLSVEFYKAYWDVLSHDLLDVFNESLASGSMPVSCRRAVITLLPKKGNLQDIKNWRPVSLLCVDYKILSKALATRLGKAVEQVIHRDQTYCVPGRSMVDNVHLIRDVLEVSSSLGINTGLISLDQEKAFDRVEHSFLWKVMEKFGFSAGFIAKIKVLYNKIESVLKFNARLDVSSSETPGLTVALCRSKTLCLQQLVDAVGPELSDAQALGSLLGLHSVRVAQRILQLWSQILCPEEKRLLRSYGQGRARPDPADPFPEIYLSPGLGELTGPLLQLPPGLQSIFAWRKMDKMESLGGRVNKQPRRAESQLPTDKPSMISAIIQGY
ncbi:hypothetical protein NHX12_033402 [Muraenolepis orangiensis]|uniref:Reverse transcriptase domain-containing protein n=1 Tax=Muraenolepis orangiensis TaxID=630683 RepID=A0A9Q0IHY1_9TELE|nr:hypothetical protein NHX12_033402 [Muraenolepis orangiensis]